MNNEYCLKFSSEFEVKIHDDIGVHDGELRTEEDAQQLFAAEIVVLSL